jgi:hypothetical protein
VTTGDAVRALLLTGGEAPYVDPWHPFAATSARLAAIAAGLGWQVQTRGDVAERLADGLDGIDVLLVNAPAPGTPVAPVLLAAAEAAVVAFVARGGGVLALHAGTVSLLGLPSWNALTGASWIAGVTGHPPVGAALLRGHDDPRVPGGIEVVDERYQDLDLLGERTVLVSTTSDDGREHPLVWARVPGAARLVADTLGHDERSFDSPGHRELLARCLAWVAGG